MKATFKLLIVLALALGTFSQHSAAFAADIFKFKGMGADAYFFSVDPSGCIVTEVGVYAVDQTFQNPPGPGSPESFAFLYLSQYDYCLEEQLLYADGFSSLGGTDLQVSRNLRQATLNATLSVYDYASDTFFDVSVDLTWTGGASVSRQNSHFHYHAPGCNFNSRSSGTFRSADVTGSVSADGTNYASEPGWGSIFSTRSGDVFAGCN